MSTQSRSSGHKVGEEARRWAEARMPFMG
jgi:hypothetical protein